MLKAIMGIMSLIWMGVGVHLCREANHVLHGGKPKDPISFKALSRYPIDDYGEHWRKKGNPEMVLVLGGILFIGGVIGIVQIFANYN